MNRKIAILCGLLLATAAWAGLETGTYINDLVATNPTGSDNYATADDHIRLVKSTIKNTFPNITGPVTFTQAQLNEAARLSAANVFTATQTASTGSSNNTIHSTCTSGNGCWIDIAVTSGSSLLLGTGGASLGPGTINDGVIRENGANLYFAIGGGTTAISMNSSGVLDTKSGGDLRINGTSVTNASGLSSGTLSDNRLSANIPRINASNAFLQSVDGGVYQSVKNSSAGTSAISYLASYNSADRGLVFLKTGPAYSGSFLTGGPSGEAGYVYTEGNIPLSLGVNNVEQLRITSSTATFAGNISGVAATFSGVVSGVGSGLTTLNASNISSGTLSDVRLSANVPLLSASNTFANTNTFQGTVALTGAHVLQLGNSDDTATSTILNSGGTSANTVSIKTGSTERVAITSGVTVGAPSGGDKGAGTLNAAGTIYQNNVAVCLADNTNCPNAVVITCNDVACDISTIAVGQSAIVYKAAATSRSSTTTLADDPVLQFTNAPIGTYFGEGNVKVNDSGGGMNYGLTVPISLDNGMYGISSCATTTAFYSNPTGTLTCPVVAKGVNYRFSAENGAIGTIAFKWAQNSSNPAATILGGSGFHGFMKITRIK